RNHIYQIQCLCEPQLGMRGLYPTVSQKGSSGEIKNMMNFITYADGTNDLIDISDRIHVPVKELALIAEKLLENRLIRDVED
ncbi:MAG: winged helix-turn-helix domain-containing protein, partial [Lachnoanaerobaculum saburreum]